MRMNGKVKLDYYFANAVMEGEYGKLKFEWENLHQKVKDRDKKNYEYKDVIWDEME